MPGHKRNHPQQEQKHKERHGKSDEQVAAARLVPSQICFASHAES
jgi:hypothetical protein